VGADKLMGDGAGILIQIPDALYREEMAKQGVTCRRRANTAWA
jgi:glutamate synthase (NADPH/NADH) large chain